MTSWLGFQPRSPKRPDLRKTPSRIILVVAILLCVRGPGPYHSPATSKQPAQQRTQRRAHRPAAEHSHAPRSPPVPHPTVRCSNTTSLAVTAVGIFRTMRVISWLLIAICSMKTSQYGQPSSNHFVASTGFPVRKLGFTFGSGGLSANLLSCTYSCGLGAM